MVGWRGAWSKQARSQTSLIARNDVSRTAEPRQRGDAIPGAPFGANRITSLKVRRSGGLAWTARPQADPGAKERSPGLELGYLRQRPAHRAEVRF